MDKNDEINEPAEFRLMGEIDPPTIQDSIAVFTDSLHFFSFYESLDDLYDSDQEAFYSYVDSNLNFISVGHLLRTDTFLTSIEDQYTPIVSNVVMEQVLNPHYEFQIGDDLISYISYEQVLVSDVSDYTTRQEIRNLHKDGSFVSLANIPDSAIWGPTYEISSFFKRWCGCKLYIQEIDCETVRIWGNCGNLLGGSGRGTIHYQDFQVGNGPSTWPTTDPLPFFNEESVKGNFEYLINITEPRSVFAKVRSNCSNKHYFANRDVGINSSCDDRLQNSGWMWIQYNPIGRALSMRLIFDRTFNYDRLKITVVHYKHYGGDNWKQEPIDYLYSTIEADVRNLPGSYMGACQIKGYATKTHSCTNCKKSERRILLPRKSNAFCIGDILGKTGGTDGTDVMWEVTKTLEGFECCD